MVEFFAGNDFDKVFSMVSLALTVNILAQPIEQCRVFARRKLLIKVGDVFLGFGKELRGVEIAQRVGREITE